MIRSQFIHADAQVYYTIDGSEPSEINGALYRKPFKIPEHYAGGEVMVRVKAYRDNFKPSMIAGKF